MADVGDGEGRKIQKSQAKLSPLQKMAGLLDYQLEMSKGGEKAHNQEAGGKRNKREENGRRCVK